MILKVYLPSWMGWQLIDGLTMSLIRTHYVELKAGFDHTALAANFTESWAPQPELFIGHESQCVASVTGGDDKIPEKRREFLSLYSVSGFRNGDPYTAIFNTQAYLMTDDGKTIESFRGRADVPTPNFPD